MISTQTLEIKSKRLTKSQKRFQNQSMNLNKSVKNSLIPHTNGVSIQIITNIKFKCNLVIIYCNN